MHTYVIVKSWCEDKMIYLSGWDLTGLYPSVTIYVINQAISFCKYTILSKLVCSSLNIVKLMLEMTFSSHGKKCIGTGEQ